MGKCLSSRWCLPHERIFSDNEPVEGRWEIGMITGVEAICSSPLKPDHSPHHYKVYGENLEGKTLFYLIRENVYWVTHHTREQEERVNQHYGEQLIHLDWTRAAHMERCKNVKRSKSTVHQQLSQKAH